MQLQLWLHLLSISLHCHRVATFSIPSTASYINRQVSVSLFNQLDTANSDGGNRKRKQSPNKATYSLAPVNMTTTGTSYCGGILTQLHKLLWSTLTFLGNRRIIDVLCKLAPTYRDTVFYFGNPPEKLVALTIDDGLSRGGSSTSCVEQVLDLLSRYDAHATFFVCSDYCTVDRETSQWIRKLVERGHELGHHMSRDVSGYYSKLSKQEFHDEFVQVKQTLEDLVNENHASNRDNDRYSICWFRAPQGVYTQAMRQTIDEWNMNYASSSNKNGIIRHVLGDCYCDDWALACKDPTFVVQTTIKQVRQGSILITHMPERDTDPDRHPILIVLERILHELNRQGYRCVSLSEMWEACDGRHARNTASKQ